MSSLLPCPTPAPDGSVERRAILRHRPRAALARVAWRASGLRFEKASAFLLDFSRQGARVLIPIYPRVGRTLWVGLPTLPCEWVKAVVHSADLSGDLWVCRLEFREPCPAGLLELVIFDSRTDGR